MIIESTVRFGCGLIYAEQATIKSEPMFHRAERGFAYSAGGPLTRAFLDQVDWPDILVDSRVHMLMPGMYPCIPGWHHDDVPRERADGQPNYESPSYKAEHCMAIWGDASKTEFAVGSHEFNPPPLGQKVYKIWHPIIELMCNAGTLKRESVPERKLVFFDWLSWHRGTEATKKGFRFFIRATRNSTLKARNELRQNANVYMPILEEGW